MQLFLEMLMDAGPLVGVLFAVACLLLIHFFWQYFSRGIGLYLRLRSLVTSVRNVGKDSDDHIKEKLEKVFRGSIASHAWTEYEETLHEQYGWSGGEKRLTGVRATLPAGAFLNLESLVDSKIGSEYFKHLPGILVGLGIIGTFLGLIQGLIDFRPDVADPTAMKEGLVGLLRNVRDAFTFSAFAISFAILVTFLEKWLYSACAKWVGELGQVLDGMFRAGVAEEYLRDLVSASQDGASQTRQLKESLVEDLKAVLTNLTDRQIAATQQLGADIGQQIDSSLRAPLAAIARTVEVASGQQTAAASTILEQLMTAFMAQMRETMGGQLGELSGLMRQTSASMAQVEQSLQSLVVEMRKATSESASGVQQAMSELMQKLADHQAAQASAVKSSTESVLEQVRVALGQMADSQVEANRRSQESVSTVTSGLEMRLKELTAATSLHVGQTQNVVDQLGSVSGEVFTAMGGAAAQVTGTVERLQEALDKMSRVAAQLTVLESRTAHGAESLLNATTGLDGASQRLATAMAQLATTTSHLQEVANAARTEQQMRAALLADVQKVMTETQIAAAGFRDLGRQVQEALTVAFGQFGDGMTATISKHLSEYQKELGNAVGILSNALQELAEQIEQAQS
jgi:hypothetical protein